eukprot:scaffold19062_cov187-Isochrysis_galbana.AAC.2
MWGWLEPNASAIHRPSALSSSSSRALHAIIGILLAQCSFIFEVSISNRHAHEQSDDGQKTHTQDQSTLLQPPTLGSHPHARHSGTTPTHTLTYSEPHSHSHPRGAPSSARIVLDSLGWSR